MVQNRVFILLGSNQGNRRSFLKTAIREIKRTCGPVLETSSVYETAAWGKQDQPAFLNQVILIQTTQTPDTLMEQLLEIELQMGRVRQEKMGPRTIDLDILFYNKLVYQSTLVTIPHPLLQERRFVLTPLHELAPRKIHPIFKKTIGTLLHECKDPLPVHAL